MSFGLHALSHKYLKKNEKFTYSVIFFFSFSFTLEIFAHSGIVMGMKTDSGVSQPILLAD